MKKQVLLFVGWVGFLVGLGGCELLDEEEPIPAYIYINDIVLTTTVGEGSSANAITDAWVFVNNQLIGAFELPATVPILGRGEHNIEIFAGISENGIKRVREVYPFYTPYRIAKNLIAGTVDTIYPQITYNDAVAFQFIEDFENSNIFGIDLDGSAASFVSITRTEAFEGQRSATINLVDNEPFQVGTATVFDLPTEDSNTPIFLELNYKNTIPFEVGIIAYQNNEISDLIYPVGLNPSDEWKKVYINLTDEAGQLTGNAYQIGIRVHAASANSNEVIRLDNIKLLH